MPCHARKHEKNEPNPCLLNINIARILQKKECDSYSYLCRNIKRTDVDFYLAAELTNVLWLG